MSLQINGLFGPTVVNRYCLEKYAAQCHCSTNIKPSSWRNHMELRNNSKVIMIINSFPRNVFYKKNNYSKPEIDIQFKLMNDVRNVYSILIIIDECKSFTETFVCKVVRGYTITVSNSPKNSFQAARDRHIQSNSNLQLNRFKFNEIERSFYWDLNFTYTHRKVSIFNRRGRRVDCCSTHI